MKNKKTSEAQKRASEKYNKKFSFLRVRVNEEKKKEIEAAAALCSMSVSALMLECFERYGEIISHEINDDINKI